MGGLEKISLRRILHCFRRQLDMRCSIGNLIGGQKFDFEGTPNRGLRNECKLCPVLHSQKSTSKGRSAILPVAGPLIFETSWGLAGLSVKCPLSIGLRNGQYEYLGRINEMLNHCGCAFGPQLFADICASHTMESDYRTDGRSRLHIGEGTSI